jgi:hypothetical protein
MQSDAAEPTERLYKNMYDCAVKTHKAEGFGGFYKGYNASLLRAIPVNASIFCAFTAAKRALGDE